MRYPITFMTLFIATAMAYAQPDSVTFDTGELLVGEIKSLDKAVFTIETAYSDADFTANWEQIRYLSTTSRFLIIQANGERHTGLLRTNPSSDEDIDIMTDNGRVVTVPLIQIVYLKGVDSGNWDRLSILIDGGYSFTKANNVRQFNVRGNVGYTEDRWEAAFNTNLVNNTTQDSIKTERRSYALSFRYYIVKDVFAFAATEWLESDEQDLDLRTNVVMGIGTAFVRNQDVTLSVLGGASLNRETFLTEGTPDAQGAEGYLALEANLFGYDDLSLYSKLQTYPSFTDKDRVRLNFDFNVKYDLPLDFYISGGTTVNYDSQPQSEDAEKTDYVFQIGVGWEF